MDQYSDNSSPSSEPPGTPPFTQSDTGLLGLIDILFDRMPMGIALLDRGFCLQRCNPTWASYIQRYTGTPTRQVTPGRALLELAPGMSEQFKSIIERVLAGETVHAEKVCSESNGIISYCDGVFAPIMEDIEVSGVLNIISDVTARVLAEQERESALQRAQQALQKLEESENALRSLVENAHHFAVYRVEIDPADTAGGRVVLVSPSLRDIVGLEDPYDFQNWFHNIHPADRARVEEANRISFEQGVPYNQTTRVYHPLRQEWVWVHTSSHPYLDDLGRISHFDGMVIDITDQMHLREAQRLHQAAEGLREIMRSINSSRPLQEILDLIAEQSCHLLQASSTMIRQLSADGDVVTTVASCDLPSDFQQIRVQPFYRQQADQDLLERKPVVISDLPSVYMPRLASDNFADQLQRAGLEITLKYYRSLLKVPLFVKEKIFGALTFHFEKPRQFSDEDLRLAVTLADQAALAIDNARLMDQIKQNAVLDERNRLARELHDSVTQTLFSTTLIAEVLPRIWERNPMDGKKRLEELRLLNRGALAEMRTLLLELRPAALLDTDLGDLLGHLVNAFIGRARVPLDLKVTGTGAIPQNVKLAFYRIAQEALNNIAKHAEAEQANLSLTRQEGDVEMVIADDGKGFEVGQLLPDHLGLGIMRERADGAGANIKISSQAGLGTRIRVFWRAEQEEQV